MPRRLFGIVIAASFVGMPAGCASSPSIGDARAAYDQRQFDEARDAAATVADAASGDEKCEAAYLAGVSAYRGGDFAAAERHFYAALESSDPILQGRTHGTLGLMRVSENRVASAAPFFKAAAMRLPGEEGAIAARRAAEAYAASGDNAEAEAMRKLAEERHPAADGNALSKTTQAQQPQKPAPAAAAGAPVGYTVQLGVFGERKNAERLAVSAAPASTRLGLGAPRILVRTAGGRTLHVVHVGLFRDRHTADRARAHLGQRDAIVAAAR